MLEKNLKEEHSQSGVQGYQMGYLDFPRITRFTNYSEGAQDARRPNHL